MSGTDERLRVDRYSAESIRFRQLLSLPAIRVPNAPGFEMTEP